MVIHVFSPLRPDLLQEKYYGLHPYLYCAANTISLNSAGIPTGSKYQNNYTHTMSLIISGPKRTFDNIMQRNSGTLYRYNHTKK